MKNKYLALLYSNEVSEKVSECWRIVDNINITPFFTKTNQLYICQPLTNLNIYPKVIG